MEGQPSETYGSPADIPTRVVYADREVCTNLNEAESREVLITNGIGSYGSLTLANSLTRSYHGLFIAALRPPLERTLLLSKLNETALYMGASYNLFTDRRKQKVVNSDKPGRRPLSTHSPTCGSSSQTILPTRDRFDQEGSACTSGSKESTSERSTTEYPHELISLSGFMHLESFHLEGTVPVFTYKLRDAVLEKKMWMKRDQNTLYVMYSLRHATHPVQLSIDALVNYRNHHHRTHAAHPHFQFQTSLEEGDSAVRILFTTGDQDPTDLRLNISKGHARLVNRWETGFVLSEERARRLPDLDDNLLVATFFTELAPGEQLTFVATSGQADKDLSLNGEAELEMLHSYEKTLLQSFENAKIERARRACRAAETRKPNLDFDLKSIDMLSAGSLAGTERSDMIRQLVLSADQFIISRDRGHSIVAGYHWFTDWTRDTMISLPGLTIVTGRYDIARSVLQTFAKYASRGMLPNRFPDDGSALSEEYYNNVDGTLWYFEAIQLYFAASGDVELLRELYSVLYAIIEHHCNGTRFGIVQDSDGLLRAGVEDLALTWMDAMTDVVYTQRDGKAVEISALWYNALRCMANFATVIGFEKDSEKFSMMADLTEKSFQEKFWNEEGGICFDVIEGGSNRMEKDLALRPNQLIAASVSWSPLTDAQRCSVVEVCRKRLLIPRAVRTLSPDDRNYRGLYHGDVFSRDSSYHQGVAWPWLLGPFVLAHLRTNRSKLLSREYLLPVLGSHLTEAGLGQISELMDGVPPHRAKGCIAQAWSVAEFLRAWDATEPDPVLK